MSDTAPASDQSLGRFLVDRARSSSDSRLALDSTLGFLIGLAAAMWGGPGWHFIVASASCFFAFGLWGIAERELADRGSEAPSAFRKVFRGLQLLACVIGGLGVITLLLSFLGVALGRIIS